MATEPQPTSQGILQASRCLERGGTVAKGPWDLPFQEIPQAPEPSNPTQGVAQQANKHCRKLTDFQGQCYRRDVTCARSSAGVLMYSL